MTVRISCAASFYFLFFIFYFFGKLDRMPQAFGEIDLQMFWSLLECWDGKGISEISQLLRDRVPIRSGIGIADALLFMLRDLCKTYLNG